jgi:hypothetical protein
MSNLPPIDIGFNYLVKGLAVTFSVIPAGTYKGFQLSWDFGDKTTGNGENVTHTYAAAGTYLVVLNGLGLGGSAGGSSAHVTVTAPPITGPPTVTTGSGSLGTTPEQQGVTRQVTGTTNDASGILGLFDNLFSSYEKEPARLREIIKETISGLSIAASVLSFIPFTNNFGGALASVLIHGLIEPFRRRAYDASIDLALRPIMPDLDLNARILVSGIEIGALSEKDLTEELARSGVRDPAINLALQVARVKRFDVETKDDIALIRSYQRDINTAAINTLQDAEKDIIGDLKRRRTEVLAELRKVRA